MMSHDSEGSKPEQGEWNMFDAVTAEREGAITHDFVDFLFETPNPDWSEFTRRYSLQGIQSQRVEELKKALVRYQEHQHGVVATEHALQSVLHELGRSMTDLEIGEMFYANAFKRRPHGNVVYERLGGMITLRIQTNEDWKGIHYAYREAEVLPSGACVTTTVQFGDMKNQETFPVVFFDERRVKSADGQKQLITHERQHLVFNRIFARFDAVRGQRWESVASVQDELLAYLADGSWPGGIVAHLRKDYSENIENVSINVRPDFEKLLVEIEGALIRLSESPLSAMGLLRGTRYAHVLLTLPFDAYPRMLDTLRLHDEKRFL